MKRVDLNTQKVTDILINYQQGSKPKVVRVHPRDDDIAAFGMSRGNLLFFNQKTKTAFTLRAIAEEEESKESTGEKRGVTELAWDPYESNLLAAFENGAVCMISYQGFCD